MVKLVDTGDLKSPALIGVPVRVRLRAPNVFSLQFLWGVNPINLENFEVVIFGCS